jgi:hypothetical protein
MKKLLLLTVLTGMGMITTELDAASFTSTGSMLTTREGHTATLLKNGKVVVIGGMHWARACIRCGLQLSALASAELYDPATGKFIPTGKMSVPRVFHTATLLGDSKVLVAGGDNRTGTTYATAELYDPATGIFNLIGNHMTTKRSAHTAARLANGKVLIAGGGNGSAFSTAEIFDPAAGTFTPTGNMHVGRFFFTATRLSDGRVLWLEEYATTMVAMVLSLRQQNYSTLLLVLLRLRGPCLLSAHHIRRHCWRPEQCW